MYHPCLSSVIFLKSQTTGERHSRSNIERSDITVALNLILATRLPGERRGKCCVTMGKKIIIVTAYPRLSVKTVTLFTTRFFLSPPRERRVNPDIFVIFELSAIARGKEKTRKGERTCFARILPRRFMLKLIALFISLCR